MYKIIKMNQKSGELAIKIPCDLVQVQFFLRESEGCLVLQTTISKSYLGFASFYKTEKYVQTNFHSKSVLQKDAKYKDINIFSNNQNIYS